MANLHGRWYSALTYGYGINHDIWPGWMVWEYFEQGSEACYWTEMEFPGWKYEKEYYENAKSCDDLYDYQDMLNGLNRG